MNKTISNQKLEKILIFVLLSLCIIHCKDQNDNLQQQAIKGPTYKRVYNSSQYYRQFASQISKISFSQTVNATYISNGKQLCLNNGPCEFFYYVINPNDGNDNFSINGNPNVRNVLFVAGMHGNEYLGPISLLYAVKHLKTPSTRIIVFPLANPSGFDRQRRTTFPTNLDPNRDFPIEQYAQCYQTSSSLIIDHIYRKYQIDLTLALHNGNSQIGWNWGTVSQQFNSKTVDEVIYRDIGEWLKFAGGMNKEIDMKEFEIGTMNEAVYPVRGGFQDWAYAASWYNASIGMNPSTKCPFSKYPHNMTSGLVFLFELGPFEVDQKKFGSEQGLYITPTSRDTSNGYISRAIRMFSGLIKILNPRMDIKFTNQNIILSLQGCKNGVIEKLKISKKSNSSQIYYSSRQKFNILGRLNNKTIESTVLQLEKHFFTETEMSQMMFQKLEDRELIVEYDFVCDPHWEGTGRTIFGQKRQFQIKQNFLLSTKTTFITEQTLFPTLQQALSSISYNKKSFNPQDQQPFYTDFVETNSETLMIIIILILVVAAILCIIWIVCKSIRRDMKARRIQRLKRKLEKINHESSIQQIGPYQPSEITLSNITKDNDSIQSGKTNKKKVESYPQMCESDKSIKTQELQQ